VKLKDITLTKIDNVIGVFSEKGRCDKMTERRSYGLSFCREGEIIYVQDGREYVSDRGAAVILPKGGTYYIKREKTGYFPVINFDCLEDLCDTVTVIPIQNPDELLADCERMKRLFFFEENRAKLFSLFYAMLHKLSSDTVPRALMGAVQLIKNSYGDPELTNARLAEECKMSEVYFRKLFTKHFATSPKQFIIDVRIQRAKQLLGEGELGILEISEMCGFSNPYHFSRIFKQHAGITPSEYRKENLVYGI